MSEEARDLSPKAREIFEKLKPYFPPGPWGKPCWESEGRVFSNGWYDLRNSTSRTELINLEQSSLGHSVLIEGETYRKDHLCVSQGELGWMTDFTLHHFPRSMQHTLELLLLLADLDFQIETMDIAEEYHDGH